MIMQKTEYHTDQRQELDSGCEQVFTQPQTNEIISTQSFLSVFGGQKILKRYLSSGMKR